MSTGPGRATTIRSATGGTPQGVSTLCGGAGARALLSFERPAGESPRLLLFRTLKTAQLANLRIGFHRTNELRLEGFDHRQDVKGTWWMPWHQEPMKDVDDCDKPRGGVEQPLIRGFPNG